MALQTQSRCGRHRRLARLGIAVGFFATVFATSSVRADDSKGASTSEDGDEQKIETLSGRLETGIYAERRGGRDTAAISPRLTLGIRVRPSVELWMSGGAATAFSDSAGGRSRTAQASNLVVGGRFIRDQSTELYRRLHVGFAFALPTDVELSDEDQRALSLALGARGGWEPWAWNPSTLGLVIPVGVEAQVWRGLSFGADAAAAALVSAAGETDDIEAVAQLGGHARYAFQWFGLRLDLRGVYNGKLEDPTQASVGAVADTALCRADAPSRIRGLVEGRNADCPWTLSARFDLNLDTPYGFLGDEGQRVWGVQLALGWSVF